MINFLLVALGGALGAMARYSLTLIPLKSGFPVATILANVLGAFLLGVIIGILESKQLDPGWGIFIKVGLCGGFTTFSTFSAETVDLLYNNQFLQAVINITVSIFLCLLAVMFGRYSSTLLPL